MFKEFVRDVVKGMESEDEKDINLSKLVFNAWLVDRLKSSDDEEIKEKEILDLINELGTNDFSEDDKITDYLYMFGYKLREDNRLANIGFKNRIQQHYGLEFYYLELTEILSRELGTLYYKSIASKEKISRTNEIILYQHIRSCSMYSEVIHLIKGGFGDGALARFRSLHENAVISEFIYKNGEDAAECYFDYLVVMDLKDLNFEERELGEKIVDPDYKNDLKRRLDVIREKRGERFVDVKRGDYEWARDFLENRVNPSFNKIRNSIDRKHGKKPYKIASNSIHSAPKSIFSLISTLDGTVHSGASNIGLSLPGTWSTYEMQQMNSLVFQLLINDSDLGLYTKLQGMFIMKILNELSSRIYENFPERENELLDENLRQ